MIHLGRFANASVFFRSCWAGLIFVLSFALIAHGKWPCVAYLKPRQPEPNLQQAYLQHLQTYEQRAFNKLVDARNKYPEGYLTRDQQWQMMNSYGFTEYAHRFFNSPRASKKLHFVQVMAFFDAFIKRLNPEHPVPALFSYQLDHLNHLHQQIQSTSKKTTAPQDDWGWLQHWPRKIYKSHLKAFKKLKKSSLKSKSAHEQKLLLAWAQDLAFQIYNEKLKLYQKILNQFKQPAFEVLAPFVQTHEGFRWRLSQEGGLPLNSPLSLEPLVWRQKKWKQLRPPQSPRMFLKLQAQELVWLYQWAEQTGPIRREQDYALNQRPANKNKAFDFDASFYDMVPQQPKWFYFNFLRFKKIKPQHILQIKDFNKATAAPESFQDHWVQKNKNRWLVRQHGGYLLTQAFVWMGLWYTYQSVVFVAPIVKGLIAAPPSTPEVEGAQAVDPIVLPERELLQMRQQQQQAWQRVVKLNHDLCDSNLSAERVSQLENELQQASLHYTTLVTTYGFLLDPEDLELFIPCVP